MASPVLREERPIELVGCQFAARDFPRPGEKSPPLSILVVDDEPLIRWSLSQTLGDSGHRIVEAGDASEAVHAMATAPLPFDVVLLDFRLPDSNDLSLLSRLRRLAPDARIIMMTALETPELMQAALDRGADRVLVKPFEMADVAGLVQSSDGPDG
jgi:DNA-binding response OmpR family regulator